MTLQSYASRKSPAGWPRPMTRPGPNVLHGAVGGLWPSVPLIVLCAPALEGVERALQPLADVDLGLVAEERARGRDVGERVAYVAGPDGAVLGLERRPRDVADVRDELVERRAIPASEVHELARELARRRRREEVRVDDVVDVAEVARLLAVAEHDGPLLADRGGDELGHDGRVLALRVLPGAEDVEVAERQRLDPVEAREDTHRVLSGELAQRVGRDGLRGHRLDLGQRRGLAVDRGAPGIDDAAHARVARDVEQDRGPLGAREHR